jgi:4-aminobutyrate aminotransferase-like enzyme
LAFIDLKRSKGNFVVDSDGNTLLDLAGTELNPLGYNHEAMINVIFV